jgi:hypothetical protein
MHNDWIGLGQCADCFIGDYQTGAAKLVPASQFGVDIPGLVVIPENEIRLPRELCNPYTANCGNASDYWDIHS